LSKQAVPAARRRIASPARFHAAAGISGVIGHSVGTDFGSSRNTVTMVCPNGDPVETRSRNREDRSPGTAPGEFRTARIGQTRVE
jgi:hypothetical protein